MNFVYVVCEGNWDDDFGIDLPVPMAVFSTLEKANAYIDWCVEFNCMDRKDITIEEHILDPDDYNQPNKVQN